MKWLSILAVLLVFYYYFLTQTTNIVLGQIQTIQNQYTYIANHADQIAASR